jgi:hypothetical protein
MSYKTKKPYISGTPMKIPKQTSPYRGLSWTLLIKPTMKSPWERVNVPRADHHGGMISMSARSSGVVEIRVPSCH